MPIRCYVDTSVFGALLDEEAPERVRTTRAVLDRLRTRSYQSFIGPPVLEEISDAPARIRSVLERALTDLGPTLIEEGEPAQRLAQAYLRAGLVPDERRNDARHIAIATVTDVDAVLSWNFRDMVNIHKKRVVHAVNAAYRYRLIDIISPLEVPHD